MKCTFTLYNDNDAVVAEGHYEKLSEVRETTVRRILMSWLYEENFHLFDGDYITIEVKE